MKRIGSKMEYSEERVRDLQRVYDDYMTAHGYLCRMTDVYAEIVKMPSRRFWVSPMRAAQVISCMMRGDLKRYRNMRISKKRMYKEIRYRVECLRRKSRYSQKSIYALCRIVVEQPAPEFYIAPGSAKSMLCKERVKWREKLLKKALR